MRKLNRIGVVECINGSSIDDYFNNNTPIATTSSVGLIEGNSYFIYKSSDTHYMIGEVNGVEYWYDKKHFK